MLLPQREELLPPDGNYQGEGSPANPRISGDLCSADTLRGPLALSGEERSLPGTQARQPEASLLTDMLSPDSVTEKVGGCVAKGKLSARFPHLSI